MPSYRRTMTTIGYALSLAIFVPAMVFAAGVLWPRADPSVPRQDAPFAITGVTIVDINTGSLIAGQTVVVRGHLIETVGTDFPVPPGVRVIAATGKFLIPALWDMHTHVHAISPLLDMPLYIAYGVTNVRDLLGCPTLNDPFIACYSDKQRWTREALAGKRVGPRIVEASSFMANGPGMAARLGKVHQFFDTATPEQARQFVAHFQNNADSIKVYDHIPRDAYFALADEARKRRLALVGHKPRAISAIEATQHQRSIEHARFILHESFDGAEQLRAAAGTSAWKEDRRVMVDRHDPAKALAIFKAMRERGTYYVPTHLTRWADAYADLPQVRDDPALAYLHPLMKMQWMEDIDKTLAEDPGPAAREAYIDFYRKGLELTAQAQANGVKIMVGTDYIAAGVDVHRELEQLVQAGLTPRQALAAATLTPAEYAGLSHAYGQIAPGRVADMVLLAGNPLLDIRNTQTIEAVVFNGTHYDSAAVNSIKSRVRDNARSWTVGAKIIWRFVTNPANY